SSDMVFGMVLRGIIPFAPILTDTTQPSNRVVIQHRMSTLSIKADGYPIPTYQWFKNGSSILNATNADYIIADMSSADVGNYFAIATNPLGMTNSRTNTVSYSTDTVAPLLSRAVGSGT